MRPLSQSGQQFGLRRSCPLERISQLGRAVSARWQHVIATPPRTWAASELAHASAIALGHACLASMRMKRKAIAIINRNHVLIRLLPSPRRMAFSEATGAQ